jgi:hypothetical protein
MTTKKRHKMAFWRVIIALLSYFEKLQYAKCEDLTSFKSKNNIYKITQTRIKEIKV